MTTPTRARECRKCKRWNHPMEHNDKTWFFCLKGHRPRYYRFRSGLEITSASEEQIRPDQPAGYRRVCDDFEERRTDDRAEGE